MKNYEDTLELYFATRSERDHWKSILDEVVAHALWTDAATMIEMETARGATRELKRRRAARTPASCSTPPARRPRATLCGR